MEKLRIKFSALNVDFDGLRLDFLGLRKPAHEGIKERYPRKIVIYRCWPVFRENSWRQFANRNCYRLSRVSWAL